MLAKVSGPTTEPMAMPMVDNARMRSGGLSGVAVAKADSRATAITEPDMAPPGICISVNSRPPQAPAPTVSASPFSVAKDQAAGVCFGPATSSPDQGRPARGRVRGSFPAEYTTCAASKRPAQPSWKWS